MNKIKKYDKEGRIIMSLNFLFNIHSFYKYEGKKIDEIIISPLDSCFMTYKSDGKEINFGDPYVSMMKISESTKFSFAYNTSSGSLLKSVEEKFEGGKIIKVEDYKNKEGITKRDLYFKFKNKINKNGKSKN